MSREYLISGETSQSEHHSGLMSANYTAAILSRITFYDEDGEVVQPSGGTVEFMLSPYPDADETGVYLTVQEGTFLASSAHSSSRTMPHAKGVALRGLIKLTSVTGAASFDAVIYRTA